jgi:hypothetical protein
MLPGIVRDFYFRPNKKHSRQRSGLGVVGGFEKRPTGTEAQLKN